MADEDNVPKVDRPKVKRNLKDRVPVNGGDRNLLTVDGRDPKYHYRFVIDDERGRVQKHLDAWYEPVHRTEITKVGDTKVDTSAGTSSVVQVKAGMGKKLVLMRIPKELYEQDQLAKQREVDASEAEMKQERDKDGRYGKFEFNTKTSATDVDR